MINQLIGVKSQMKANSPLIHCITNPISINDCANGVLAVGAKPIMAEHPKEVEEITSKASALAINLGNISDIRMESMMLSGKVALKNRIPSVIDLVGVGCSKLRLEFAKNYIRQNKPTVIKGNMSEIKAIAGLSSNSVGIDVGKDDVISDKTVTQFLQIMKQLSEQTGAIVVATGITDLIVLQNQAYLIRNGVEMLSQVTGTGCLLNVLIASYLSTGNVLPATILAVATISIAGELTETEKGTGSFKVGLMDAISTLTNTQIRERIRIKEVTL